MTKSEPDAQLALAGVDEAKRLLAAARRDLRARRGPESWVPLVHAAVRALEVATPDRETWWVLRQGIV